MPSSGDERLLKRSHYQQWKDLEGLQDGVSGTQLREDELMSAMSYFETLSVPEFH